MAIFLFGSDAMPTAKEYRQQARAVLELSKSATDPFARITLTELANEFNQAADQLERPSLPNEVRPRPSNPPKPSRNH